MTVASQALTELLLGGLAEPVLFAAVTLTCFSLYVAFMRRVRFARRVLPLQRWSVRIFPPTVRTLDLTVAYALIPPSEEGLPYFMVEEGDVRCLYLIHSLLAEHYGRDRVHAVSERDLRPDVHRQHNLVILSGPVWNKTMELYLGLTGSPVEFAWDDEDLKLVDSDDVEYTTDYVGDHRVKTCHGLIVGAHVTVFGRSQRVVIVAGCSNLSTYAGACFLSHLTSDRRLRREIRRSRVQRDSKWAIVYSVANWAEDPGASDGIPTMQSGALQLKTARVYRASQFREPYEFHLSGARND